MSDANPRLAPPPEHSSQTRPTVARIESPTSVRRGLLWRALLCLPVLALLVFQFVEARLSADRQIGTYLQDTDNSLEVLEVTPGSPAEEIGIQPGDVLITLAGLPVTTFEEYDHAAQSLERGSPVEIQVSRSGQSLTFTAHPGMPTSWGPLLVNALTTSIYLGLGLLAIAGRPGFLPASLLFWYVLLLAISIAEPSVYVGAPRVQMTLAATSYLLGSLQLATEVHLVSLLPQRREWLKRWPRMIPVFYITGVGVGLLGTLTYLVEDLGGRDLFPWTLTEYETYFLIPGVKAWAALLVILLLIPALRFPTARGRRQAAILLAGLAPWVIYHLVTATLTDLEIIYPSWVDIFWSLALLPFPIAVFIVLAIEANVRHRVLLDLISRVESATSMEEIEQEISHDLDLAFHTRRNYVFFRGQGSELTSIHSSGAGFHVERIPDDSDLLRLVEASGDVVVFSAEVAASLSHRDRDWLERLKSQLLVPLKGSDQELLGLLILGHKASEEPYTPPDLDLLRALGRQIALAYENIGLHVQVRERERLHREVLHRLEDEKRIELVRDCPRCGLCFGSGVDFCPEDGAQLKLSLPVERVIEQRYRLEKVIGRGGVALVYLASDLHLHRRVAIKVLARTVLDDTHALLRFEREARVAGRLAHPNIVVTHDFGETENGCAFIVMELLEGKSLRQILKRRSHLQPETAAEWISQMLDGLAEAHRQGVVHRDMKPDNVMLVRGEDGTEQIKLLDFGLAKMLERPGVEAVAHVTAPGTIMGTLAYMSPEQLSGGAIDPRSDLYAVGVIAFEVITGRRPFEGKSAAQFLNAIVGGSIEFPTDTVQLLELQMIFQKCFHQSPSARYASAAQLKKVLVPALRACPELAKKSE